MKTLIVVDMQNDFITGPLGSEYARDVVLPNVVNKIREGNYDNLIFTRDCHQKDYLINTLEGKKLPVEHCIVNTKGFDLANEIKDNLDFEFAKNSGFYYHYKGKKVLFIDKDTFGSRELANRMLGMDHDNLEIEICGLCTDICVVSNALLLRTFNPDTKIVCDSSCCGGTSKENHESALTVMRSCQIDVI